MPLVVWAYPRGSAVKAKGGIDSLYAVDYAARVACEIGADVIKLNEPVWKPDDAAKLPKPYDTLQFDDVEGLRKVVKSAGRSLVLGLGGSKMGDDDDSQGTSRWPPAASGSSSAACGSASGTTRSRWRRASTTCWGVTARRNKRMRRRCYSISAGSWRSFPSREERTSAAKANRTGWNAKRFSASV